MVSPDLFFSPVFWSAYWANVLISLWIGHFVSEIKPITSPEQFFLVLLIFHLILLISSQIIFMVFFPPEIKTVVKTFFPRFPLSFFHNGGSWIFHIHFTNHLEGLLKHRFLSLILHFLILLVWKGTWELEFPTSC